MKRETNPDLKLGKRLAGYSAAAGALLALSPAAKAQIIYSGEQNLEFYPAAAPQFIDLDDDGINDFLVYLTGSYTQFTTNSYYVTIATAIGVFANGNPTYNNSWLGTYNATVSTYFPAALGSNVEVNSSASVWLAGYGLAPVILEYFQSMYAVGPTNTYSYYAGYGYFRGGTNYLGMRFHIGSALHYGWVRIMIADLGSPITLVDWAYNSDVEEGMTTGFVESAFDNETIYYGLTAVIGLNFDEPISNLALEDFEISGGTVSGLSAITAGEEYELTIHGDEEGIIDLTLPTGAVDSEGKVVLGAHTQFTMLTSVGLEKALENSVQLFPNPAHQELTISLDGEADLSVLNALGQKVMHFDGFRGERIDISSLPQGSYTALFRSDQETFTRKFIKQ